MKLTEQEEAKKLFFQTSKTQKEIADAVGVSDRTIRQWIKDEAWQIMKQRALEMPSVIVDNLCAQYINLQNKIMERDGIPTLEETQMMHKLTLCIIKLKDYPSSGSMIQFMQNFLDDAKGDDPAFLLEATRRANHMILKKNKQGFTPFDFEYGTQPSYINTKLSSFDKEEYPRSGGGGLNQTETQPIKCPPLEGAGGGNQTETKSFDTNNTNTNNTSLPSYINTKLSSFDKEEYPRSGGGGLNQTETKPFYTNNTNTNNTSLPSYINTKLSSFDKEEYPLGGDGLNQTETKSFDTNNITPPCLEPERTFSSQPEIPTQSASQSIDNKEFTLNCKEESKPPEAEKSGNFITPPLSTNKEKPGVWLNNAYLEWLGAGEIHDYAINKQRKITSTEWYAFLKHGYTLEEMDNYSFQSDPIYDEQMQQEALKEAAHRQRINDYIQSMKKQNPRRTNHW